MAAMVRRSWPRLAGGAPFGEALGPGEGLAGGGAWGGEGKHLGLAGLWGLALRREVGAEPADEAALLLVRALAVQGDEPLQDLLVREVVRPAVGVEDGGLEVVVDLAQDGDEAGLVDRPLLAGGRLGARDLEDVAQLGEEEILVGPLGGARGGPAGDEVGDGHARWRAYRGGPTAEWAGGRRSR